MFSGSTMSCWRRMDLLLESVPLYPARRVRPARAAAQSGTATANTSSAATAAATWRRRRVNCGLNRREDDTVPHSGGRATGADERERARTGPRSYRGGRKIQSFFTPKTYAAYPTDVQDVQPVW